MLSVIDEVTTCPALSTTVPVMTWFGPSVTTVTDGEQAETPAPAAHVKLTVTSLWLQLPASGGGHAVAVTVGSVNCVSWHLLSRAETPSDVAAVGVLWSHLRMLTTARRLMTTEAAAGGCP